MRLILIGFAASYKTSVGKILAQKLGAELWDTDLQVERAMGMSVAEIFHTQGESAFRKAESEALENLKNATGVISCGGGAVLSPAFNSFSQGGGVVVWLQSSAQTVRARLQEGARPLFDGMSVEQLENQLQQRKSYYEKFATFAVSTDEKTSAEVAEEVMQMLALLNCN